MITRRFYNIVHDTTWYYNVKTNISVIIKGFCDFNNYKWYEAFVYGIIC